MTDQDRLYHDVFDILATTVLIDHRTKDRELIELVHAANEMNQLLRPGLIQPRQAVLHQFAERSAYINDGIDSENSEKFKRDMLSKITDTNLQCKVLGFIFAISVCDYELHDEESDFIKTALNVWNADMPTPQELEPAC